MPETLFYVLSRFWVGAVDAATRGHGKTIAAAYIVGARGRPIDAVILGVFVTLSHTTGIVLVGVLASLGSAWLVPQRVEAYLALATGLLVVALGLWMLWTQRDLLAQAMGAPLVAAPADGAGHEHHHPGNYPHHHHHDDNLGHRDGAGLAWHSHGWGTVHSHRLDLVTERRPQLACCWFLPLPAGFFPTRVPWQSCWPRCRADGFCWGWQVWSCSASAWPRHWWSWASLPHKWDKGSWIGSVVSGRCVRLRRELPNSRDGV